MSAPTNAIGLLSQALRGQRARRAFRAPGCRLPSLEGIDELAVPSASVAVALADADGRLARSPLGPGVALLPERTLRISARPGAGLAPQPVDDAGALVLGVAGWSLGTSLGGIELEIGLGDDDPVPDDVEPLDLSTDADRLLRLAPDLADLRGVLVLGPGVARAGHGAAALDGSRHTGWPIVLAPSAAGAVPSAHPSVLGVIGLQARDAELVGLADADLLVTSGLDPLEALPLPGTVQVLEVEPWHLEVMAAHWGGPRPAPEASALRLGLERLLSATASTDPPAPWQLLDVVRRRAGDGAVVAADAGPAGLWSARGLPLGDPTQPWAPVVPAAPAHGFAAAAAFVAALDGRRGVALLDADDDPTTEEILRLARGLDLPVVALGWAECRSASADLGHAEELLAAGAGRSRVAVDLGRTDDLLDLAGPLVVWSGP